jgi:hypothetical protein
MAENAYALFFLVVLVGSAVALYVTVQPNWAHVMAALRGETVKDPSVSETVAPPCFTDRGEPRIDPVVISICRLAA